MKKFAIFALALALCVAFTAPAMAKYTVGAKIKFTTGYKSTSEERTTSGKDVTSFWAAVEGHSRLFVSFINAAKDTGGYVELGLSSYTSASVSLRHVYGWYKVGNHKFLAGHTDNWVGSLFSAPSQNVSITPNLYLLFIGWGAEWGLRRPQLQYSYKNGGFGLQVGIAQPTRGSRVAFNGTSVDVYNTLPEFFAGIEFRVAGFAMIPSFTWVQYNGEGVGTGDDSISAWGVELPMKYNVGPISIRFGLHYAKNPSLTPWDNYADEANGRPVLKSNGTFEDTTNSGGYFGLHYYAGVVKFYAGVGLEKFENDQWAKKDYTRIGYFLAMRYEVNKNFFIHPEFGYYDYGDNYTTGADNGNEWVLGALIEFDF